MRLLALLALALVGCAGCASSPAEAWLQAAPLPDRWPGGVVTVQGDVLTLIPSEWGPVWTYDAKRDAWAPAGFNATQRGPSVAWWHQGLLKVADIHGESEWYAVPCGEGAPTGCHGDGVRTQGTMAVWSYPLGNGLSQHAAVVTAGVARHNDVILVMGGALPNGTATTEVASYGLDASGPRIIGHLAMPTTAPQVVWSAEEAILLLDRDGHGRASRIVQRFDPATGEGSILAMLPDLDYATAVTASDGRRVYVFGAVDPVEPTAARVVRVDLNGGMATILDERMPLLLRSMAVAWVRDGFLLVGADPDGEGDAAESPAWRFRP